jgi:hypothetical protein
MKLVRWARFAWDLTNLSPVYPAVDACYRIRLGNAGDEAGVRAAVLASFSLDQQWNYLLREIRDDLDAAMNAVFPPRREKPRRLLLGRKNTALSESHADRQHPDCLVLTHGSRVIGVSILSFARQAENHLLTGPCVMMEYRNRGLATALLAQSLVALRSANLTVAHGMTKFGSPTAQFVYSKFGSQGGPDQHEPRLAAG